jgi:prepilin-type N-terminal cleavage/methylation domain-containing protein/prepilin-type processing-associated H-X9-DG protein
LDSLKRAGRGFTLIELLVVVSVLGILMAVLLPNIFSSQTATDLAACKLNLKNLYQMLTSYKMQNHQKWPRESGVRFVLAVTQKATIYEPTEQNVGTFFCPAIRGGNYLDAVEKPGEWFCPGGRKLDQATSLDSDYAGRDMKRYYKGVGSSNLQALVCDDNEGEAPNHPGVMNVLFAGGQVQDFPFEAWIEEGLIGPEDNVPVGPDSPIQTKRCDLTKLRID